MSEPTNPAESGDTLHTGNPETAELEPEERKVPMGTFVFGLVLVAVGLILLAGILYGLTLDPAVVAVGIVVGAGILLIVGGLIAGRRSGTRA